MKDTEGKSTEMFEFHFPAKELAGPVLYLRAVGMPHCPPPPRCQGCLLPTQYTAAKPSTWELNLDIAPHAFCWGGNKNNGNLVILVITRLGGGREPVSPLPA